MPEENNVNTNEEETTQGNESTTEGTPATEGSSSLINYNFERVRGTIEVNENTQPLLVTRTRPIYSVTFNVIPEDAKIEILISDDIILTDKKIYTLFPGEYRYRITKEGKPTREDRFTIVDQNIVLNIDLDEIVYPEPDKNNKYNVFVIISGIDCYSFLEHFTFELEYDGNVYTGKKISTKIAHNILDYMYGEFGFKDVPEGNVIMRAKIKSDSVIEGYEYEPEVAYTVPIYKISPNYIGDEFEGVSNVFFYSFRLKYKGPSVELNYNFKDNLVINVDALSIDKNEEIPTYTLDNKGIYYYPSVLYKESKTLTFNPGYEGIIEFSLYNKSKEYNRVAKKIKIDNDNQTIDLDFKPLQYKSDKKFNSIYGMSNNNKVLIVGDLDKLYYISYNDDYTFTTSILPLDIPSYTLRKVFFDGTREYMFVVLKDKIVLLKINEDNTIVKLNEFNHTINNVLSARDCYSDINGKLVTFVVYNDENEMHSYVFKRNDNTYVLYKNQIASLTYICIPHNNGVILNYYKGMFYIDNGSEIVKGTCTNMTIGELDKIFILNDMAIIGIYDSSDGDCNVSVYPCSIDNNNYSVTLDLSKKFILGKYHNMAYGYYLNDKDVLLTTYGNTHYILRNTESGITKRPLCPSNGSDTLKSILKRDYGNINVNGFSHTITHMTSVDNKFIVLKSDYFEKTSNMAIYTQIDQEEPYCVSYNGDTLYDVTSDSYFISKDGTMLINNTNIYRFINDNRNIEMIGYVGGVF